VKKKRQEDMQAEIEAKEKENSLLFEQKNERTNG